MGVKLAYVTVNRSDFGRMTSVLRCLGTEPGIEVQLIVTGNHHVPRFGHTRREIGASGIPVAAEIPFDQEYDPAQVAAEILGQLPGILSRLKADCLLLLGDRHEMLACALTALHLDLPIVHIGGGYLTEGAIDDRVRHAITKLAAYHLVANRTCAQRVIQMGEPEDRVFIVGAPDLEMIRQTPRASRQELLAPLDLDPGRAFLLVTIHPETQGPGSGRNGIEAAFAVLAERPEQVLVTAPAAERGADLVFRCIDRLCAARTDCRFVRSLGETRYIQALHAACAMFGNSSSGVIESSAVPVPAVNIGPRQKGREHARNVISVAMEKDAMRNALETACSADFRRDTKDVSSPYGDGRTSRHVLEFFRRFEPEAGKLPKPFGEM